jgi:hypothetical protein
VKRGKYLEAVTVVVVVLSAGRACVCKIDPKGRIDKSSYVIMS